MRLIDADALIEESESGGWDIDIQELQMILKYVPTISAVPVVRGEWLNFAGDFQTAECNKCGELYDVSDHADEKHFAAFKQFYKYCPNCGCDMRGERDGEK